VEEENKPTLEVVFGQTEDGYRFGGNYDDMDTVAFRHRDVADLADRILLSLDEDDTGGAVDTLSQGFLWVFRYRLYQHTGGVELTFLHTHAWDESVYSSVEAFAHRMWTTDDDLDDPFFPNRTYVLSVIPELE
jgi:hypothetical protein